MKQDSNYKSDFEEIISIITETGKLPEPPHDRFSIKSYMDKMKEIDESKTLSEFNQNLKKGLDYNPKEKED